MIASKVKIERNQVKSRDMKITIEVSEKIGNEVGDIDYKGFVIKPDVETGEFDVYSVGGALVTHAATEQLARDYIDSVNLGG